MSTFGGDDDFATAVVRGLDALAAAQGLVERIGEVGCRITEAGRAKLREMSCSTVASDETWIDQRKRGAQADV